MVYYFKLEETPINPGRYLIRPNFDKLPLYSTDGSYNVVMARVMGVSYANYLRLCRDEYSAEVIGKNNLYPIAYFTELNRARELEKELNKRAEKLLKERK